jgi:hypothetical protein
MTQIANLSSLELLLLGIDQPVAGEVVSPVSKGDWCPQCRKAQLDYNGLLQLECPACGFINKSGGGSCT